MPVVISKWIKYKDDILATPKFLKRGTKVLVVGSTYPKEEEVEGRYGKRKMFIVETKGHGLIYVSPMQLVNIVEAFDGNYDSAVTVEL